MGMINEMIEEEFDVDDDIEEEADEVVNNIITKIEIGKFDEKNPLGMSNVNIEEMKEEDDMDAELNNLM